MGGRNKEVSVMSVKKILMIILCLAAFISLAFVVFGLVRTRQMLRSEEQPLFGQGRVPTRMPDGFYAGSAAGYEGTWKGKEFDASNMKGVNIFRRRNADRRLYPFSMSTGKGVSDTELDVLRIDYDIDANPFWLRPVLDEVVEIEGGVLLGKLQYRLIPRKPFSIIFFRLER